MQPEPVQMSAMFSVSGCACARSSTSFAASSTSSSVSGFGIRTAGETSKVLFQKSLRPVRYATGIPSARLKSSLAKASVSSAETLSEARKSRSFLVQSKTWASSSAASSSGVVVFALFNSAAPHAFKAKTVPGFCRHFCRTSK